MFQFKKIAATAAAMFFIAALPARAADVVTANDTALFLAGMQPSGQFAFDAADQGSLPGNITPGSSTAPLPSSNSGTGFEIRDWSAANLAAPRSTMFYMFGGPDFLYADAFDYKGDDLCAEGTLEVAGLQLPDLTELPRGGVGAALYNAERSMASILEASASSSPKTDEGRSARRPTRRHLADPRHVPGAFRQKHSRGQRGGAGRERRAASRQ